MRFSPRTVLTALTAILALSAVAVSSASAAPEWYVKKGGTYSKATTAVGVNVEAVKAGLVLGSQKEGYRCTTSNWGEGKVESAGAGKFSRFGEFPEPSGHCEAVKGGSGVFQCTRVEKTQGVNLPWKTELYTEGSEIRDKIISGGAGTPGIEVECWNAVFGKFTFACEGATSLHLRNNSLPTPLVEGEFDSKSAKLKCKGGGGEPGEWIGVVKIKPTAEEKTKGIEGIKVE
jgi:hypothetical protein